MSEYSWWEITFDPDSYVVDISFDTTLVARWSWREYIPTDTISENSQPIKFKDFVNKWDSK